ncbi:phage virion morphogenesis protein [Glaciimonas sp. PCH181]|uniref:phage virion morphogenesis protein n=1 Tax=Glaciimonas sp. PCH181 TaxID=2133943 RepID=UPI000D3AEEF4|nr:phage virion morphogenesis protein [Glaciimonas sp. PCH181]PUA16820.1 phage virion morphogenesis protein [Glaciimonas sp. PCH181]
MSDDLSSLELWAGALLSKLQPAERLAVNRKVAQDLRRSQTKRIASQHDAEGNAYAARKNRKKLRGKQGRIKHQKAAMFTKLRTAANLKIRPDANQLSVGFFGRVARIARIHQEGLSDRVSQKGPEYLYPARGLLGFSAEDRELIRDSLLRHLMVRS